MDSGIHKQNRIYPSRGCHFGNSPRRPNCTLEYCSSQCNSRYLKLQVLGMSAGQGTHSAHKTHPSFHCRYRNSRPRPTGIQARCWRRGNTCRSSGCGWSTRQIVDPGMHIRHNACPSQDFGCCSNPPHPTCIQVCCSNHDSIGHSSSWGWGK